jgi:hypothetical protein
MKSSKSLLAVAVIAACAGFVSAQSWQWANAVTGTGNEVIKAVAADNAGNAYVTGYYKLSTPAFGATALPYADTSDAFIAKYNNSGQLQWAKRISNPKAKDAGLAIAVDPAGNIIVGGYLQPNNTAYPLGDSAAPSYPSALWKIEGDAFIAKYNPSGTPLWVKRVAAGTKSLDAVTGISIDDAGNIYTSGYCYGGTTTATWVYYSDEMQVGDTIKNGNDGFAAKFDNNGNFIWFRMIKGNTQVNYAYDIAPDAQGNAYVVGLFRDTLKFGNTPYLRSKNSSNDAIFVTKLNASDGTPAWIKAFTDSAGEGNFNTSMGCGIVAANGSVYIAGQFKRYLGLGSTVIRLSKTQNPCGFLAKLKATDGSTIAAYKMLDTIGAASRITDVVLKNNLFLLSGFYAGTIRFSSSIFTSSGATDQNPFIAALDTSFSELWALSGTGSGSDSGFSVAVGKSSIFLGGCYKAATLTFTGVTPALTNATTTANNGFIASAAWASAIRYDARQASRNSPALRILSGADLTVLVDNQSSGDLRASLIDISGRVAASQRISREGRAAFGANGLAPGRYIVRVTAGGKPLYSCECVISGM